MIYVISSLVILSILYLIMNYVASTLPLAETGPVSNTVRHTGIRKVDGKINSVYEKTVDGRIHKYRRFIVQGSGMNVFGINSDDIICVRMMYSHEEKTKLKEGTPVMIFLNDDKFRRYLIRLIKRITDDEILTTYHNASGQECESSDTYSLESVIGVVDLEESGIVINDLI